MMSKLLKGVLDGRFGGTMKSLGESGAEFCIFLLADYPHVKHRKCRSSCHLLANRLSGMLVVSVVDIPLRLR
jgi:hypothetical protein